MIRLAILALGIALGVVVALYLVFWRSGAEPETEPAKCGGRTWLPYEDDEGFGYREWFCQQPVGHPGRHSGWLGEPDYDGEALGVG